MHGEHSLGAEPAAATLVGHGGVRVTVTEHPLSRRQSRADDFGQQLGAAGEHQGELGSRSHALGARVQQNSANAFADECTAGFARGHHLQTLGAQHGC